MRVVFFYLMKPLPERVRAAAPLHSVYWESLNLDGYAGAPFADRSGGMIVFETAGLEAAAALVDRDPFVTHDLLETKWLKEWASR